MKNLSRIVRCGALACSVLLGVALALAAFWGAPGFAQNRHGRVRWDIASNSSFSPVTIVPGGRASALAADGSLIPVTGTGTFVATAARFSAIAISGGGTWETFDSTGAPTDSGTYRVLRGPASFQVAPGSLPPGANDQIADADDSRSGLARFDIEYSDGSRGWLVVSCDQPVGTPNTIFEGITASKGFVNYWNRVPPVPGVDGNRTLFHVVD